MQNHATYGPTFLSILFSRLRHGRDSAALRRRGCGREVRGGARRQQQNHALLLGGDSIENKMETHIMDRRQLMVKRIMVKVKQVGQDGQNGPVGQNGLVGQDGQNRPVT